MLSWSNKIWSGFRNSMRGFDTAHQLAAGVAAGMLIGLIPKDSLFPYVFLLLAILSTANLLALIVSALTFTWISPMLDSITDRIGSAVLNYEPLMSLWAQLFQLPVVPWTRFDNTVVTGSLVLAVIAAWPLYAIAKVFFKKTEPALRNGLTQVHFVRWLLGSPAESVSESPSST